MDWKVMVLRVLILTAISLLLFEGIKRYVLTRFNIKKSYMFISMIIIIILPFLFPKAYTESTLLQQGMMLLFIISMLTYFEIARRQQALKNKPIVGKPKAKPNRVKNLKIK